MYIVVLGLCFSELGLVVVSRSLTISAHNTLRTYSVHYMYPHDHVDRMQKFHPVVSKRNANLHLQNNDKGLWDFAPSPSPIPHPPPHPPKTLKTLQGEKKLKQIGLGPEF